MNKREHEENIAILKSMIPEYEMKNKMFGVKALKDGISALEKQIPKKRYIKFPYSYCPVCNENITDESPNYCPECGQAIDWRNEDE